MKYRLIFLVTWFFVAIGAVAQCDAPAVSMNRALEEPEDYLEGQDEVEKALDWLCVQPLDQCVSAREQLNSYVMLWLSGSPHFTLEFDPASAPFLSTHPDLLFPMIHGMTKEMLKRQNPSVMELYSGGFRTVDRLTRDMPRKEKSSELRALHKAVRKGNLRDYMQEHCSACSE